MLFKSTAFAHLTPTQKKRLLDRSKFHSLKRQSELSPSHQEPWVLAVAGLLGVETGIGDERVTTAVLRKGVTLPLTGKEFGGVHLRAILPSDILEVPADTVYELAQENGFFSSALLRDNAHRLGLALGRAGVRASAAHVPSKLAYAFMALGEPTEDGSLQVSRKVPQKTIGELVGLSREQVNRQMSWLRTSELLQDSPEHYTVPLAHETFEKAQALLSDSEFSVLSEAWRQSRIREHMLEGAGASR